MKHVQKLAMTVIALFLASAVCTAPSWSADKKSGSDDAIHWAAPSGGAGGSAQTASQQSVSGSTYDPMDDDLASMWDRMDRMQQSMMGQFGMMPRSPLMSQPFLSSSIDSDIAEMDKELIIQCDLPSVPKESIEISVDGSMLLVRAIRNAGTDKSGDDNGQKYQYRERSYGSTERRFKIGSGVDPKKIKADYKDGVLTIRVPKGDTHAVRVPIS